MSSAKRLIANGLKMYVARMVQKSGFATANPPAFGKSPSFYFTEMMR